MFEREYRTLTCKGQALSRVVGSEEGGAKGSASGRTVGRTDVSNEVFRCLLLMQVSATTQSRIRTVPNKGCRSKIKVLMEVSGRDCT